MTRTLVNCVHLMQDSSQYSPCYQNDGSLYAQETQNVRVGSLPKSVSQITMATNNNGHICLKRYRWGFITSSLHNFVLLVLIQPLGMLSLSLFTFIWPRNHISQNKTFHISFSRTYANVEDSKASL